MKGDLTVSQLQPLAGYVLVQPAVSQKQTASGIYLPENSSEKPKHGTVLAVGGATYIDGREVTAPVKKNDHVIYKPGWDSGVKIDDIEYQFLKFEEILAIVK